MVTVFLILATFFPLSMLCTSVKTLDKWERRVLVWVLSGSLHDPLTVFQEGFPDICSVCLSSPPGHWPH